MRQCVRVREHGNECAYVYMQACVNPFAVCTIVNLCACGGCLSVCFHACVCILPSICVQLGCAVPTAILTAVDWGFICILNRSSSRHCCCDSARQTPAHIAAAPVMFGYSCSGEPMAGIQTATASPGLGL